MPEKVLFMMICLGIVLVLLRISYTDLRIRKIGKKETFCLMILGLWYGLFYGMAGKDAGTDCPSIPIPDMGWMLVKLFLAAFFLAAFVEAVNLFCFHLKGMGGGDIRVIYAMGLLFGFQRGMEALLISLLLAVLVMILVSMGRRQSKLLPMGPFLAAGIYIRMMAQLFLMKEILFPC